MNECFWHLNDISALDISQPFLCIFRMWTFASLLSLDSPITSWQSTPSETPDFLFKNLALHLGMYFCRIGITRACSSHPMAQSWILAGNSALKPIFSLVHGVQLFNVPTRSRLPFQKRIEASGFCASLTANLHLEWSTPRVCIRPWLSLSLRRWQRVHESECFSPGSKELQGEMKRRLRNEDF